MLVERVQKGSLVPTVRNARRYTRSDIHLWEVLATRLKATRESRALSQTALARRIRTSQGLLSVIEAGKRPEVSAMVVARLARALDVSADYLLGLTDVERPSERA
jgi:transcriptional regulator with XRE-family HTH domain